MDEIFSCPACERQFPWKAQYAEKQVKCKCGEVFTAPAEPQSPDEDLYEIDEADDPKPAPAPTKEPAHDVTAAVPVETDAEEDDSYGVEFDDEPAKPAAPARKEAAESVSSAAPMTADADATCPECGHGISSSAVMCINCGFNLKEGRKLDTSFSKVVDRDTGSRRRLYDQPADGFFGRLSRSWEFAKISYGILWAHKSLLVFPVFSTVASVLVLASFLLPLWGAGQMEHFMALVDSESTEPVPFHIYLITFAFYFCGFFVIVYFNTALTACAMKVCDGQSPTVGYGLSVATKRLPQIASWALVSAIVGVILKAIENASEKAGRFIAALIGTAWTVLTYFVVPVLCVEGVGPVEAVKQSAKTIKSTWGEMIMGNFSLGLLSFLITLPLFAICFVIIFIGAGNDSMAMVFVGLGLFVICAILVSIASSAADVIFKALLYNYATGRSVPADLDETTLDAAFASAPDK